MKKNLADWLKETVYGHEEWDGVVSACQMWYYGWVLKAAWCATCVSWAAYHCGILHQIGGKNENVCCMMEACKDSGYGTFITGNDSDIQKGDILFYNWDSGEMSPISSKHVGVAVTNTKSTSDMILTIGGNQDDKCCNKYYPRKNLYAIFRPNYKEE